MQISHIFVNSSNACGSVVSAVADTRCNEHQALPERAYS